MTKLIVFFANMRKEITLEVLDYGTLLVRVLIAGWGTLSYGGPLSEVLMEVAVPVWNQQRCVRRYTQPIMETNLCAGAYEGGKDSCQVRSSLRVHYHIHTLC
jgi:hypothetical protein